MKSATTLLVLFALVAFATQCGSSQPAQPNVNQGTPSPQTGAPHTQVLTKTNVPVGKSSYKVGNGRGWNQLENSSKEMFLEGMISGIVAALQRSSSMLNETEMTNLGWLMSAGDKHSLADVVQQIDAFYADSANLNIPILEAYKYAFYKFEGASQEALNKAVSDLRAKYKE